MLCCLSCLFWFAVLAFVVILVVSCYDFVSIGLWFWFCYVIVFVVVCCCFGFVVCFWAAGVVL